QRGGTAFPDALAAVRDHAFHIDGMHHTQSFAPRTGAIRGIEGKGIGTWLLIGESRSRLHQVFTVLRELSGGMMLYEQQAFTHLQCFLDALAEAYLTFFINGKTVYYQLYVMYLIAVQLHAGLQLLYLAVYPGTQV